MSKLLHVWFEEKRVGTIHRKSKSWMTFAYDANWLASPESFDISLSMPRRQAPYEPEPTHAFFQNLLPEDKTRTQVERALQISPGNDFDLLGAIGADCAGALAILPEDEQPSLPSDYTYAPINNTKLAEIITTLPRRPLLAGEKDVRLSLAGAQTKLSLGFTDGKYCLPLNGAPGSLILKPPMDDLDGMVENEAFCMTLASAIGLGTPETSITTTTPRAFIIQRYDRPHRKGRTVRIHQEDFCQALGVPPEHKYEKEGGPRLADCFTLLERTNDPKADKHRLLAWVVFNFLVGNADAHAKNISLLYDRPPKPNLAPFYDIICTGVYEGLSRKLSMKIGGQYDPDYIFDRHWERLAQSAGFPEKDVLNKVTAISQLLHEIAQPAVAAFSQRYGTSPVTRRIAAFIMKRCTTTLDRLSL